MASFLVWMFATPVATETTFERAVPLAEELSRTYAPFTVTVKAAGVTVARFESGERVE